MTTTSYHLVLGAMSLLAAQGQLLTNTQPAVPAAERKIEALNAASLKSIESSWLEISASCKARGFNADPVSLQQKEARAEIQAVYALFEA